MAATPAFYRSADPISNFVVRVAVRKRTPPNQGGVAAPSAASGFDDERMEHVAEFAWQQKVFGPRFD